MWVLLLVPVYSSSSHPELFFHALQGREADIVIFSCVRAKSRAEGDAPGVGFLADVRRMNVALTRARRALWIVGHSETLKVHGAGVL